MIKMGTETPIEKVPEDFHTYPEIEGGSSMEFD